MYIETVNPFSEELLNKYQKLEQDAIGEKVSQANAAIKEWNKVSLEQRCVLIRRVAEILRNSEGEFSSLITDEMGKLKSEARAEVEKCALLCDYYADNTEQFLQDESIETDASRSFVSFEALGLVLGVMPWNFPFWQVFRFAIPALLAGNACLLKHASNVSGCAIAIEDIFRQANLPSNVFLSLIIDSSQVASVVENPLVKAVSLTGSTGAGKAVAEIAGKNLKKIVVELGGSDPYVVLSDADLETAVEACITSRLLNAGQSCISAKRFVIHKDIYQEFERQFVANMNARQFGDPKDEQSTIAPMAKFELREQLHQQVSESINCGAKLLCGGEIPAIKGNFYPPTVLSEVQRGSPAYEQELFGPVASLIRADSDAEAIRIANDTVFGLGAALFSKDRERALKFARQIEAGSVAINSFVKSDPRLPFGGTKESGFGRELSHYGIKEFVNIKTIVID